MLVRDDFWMAVTRFLAEVEVELVQGHNAAAVDLFPPRHAEKVLAAFGRAFGRLPEQPSKDEEAFLDQAVGGLSHAFTAEDGGSHHFEGVRVGDGITRLTARDGHRTLRRGLQFSGRQGYDDALNRADPAQRVHAPLQHRAAGKRHERLGPAGPKALAPSRGHDQRDRHPTGVAYFAATATLRLPLPFGEMESSP